MFYLGNLWGLLGLLAIPTIIVIHMYHRRFPPLVVAGLHLWTSEVRQQLPGRKRERLPITTSLILELLAALLLTLLLCDPHLGNFGKAVHLVVVLDNSASMQGKPPGKDERSFRDDAVATLTRRAERLPHGSVVTLIRTGLRPELLAGPGIPWVEAKSKLDEWKPQAPRHPFDSAWDLGVQLVAEAGELLFLTDVLPAADSLPKKMEVVSFGRKLENVALTDARWTFDPATGKGTLFGRVHNIDNAKADVTVTGSVAGKQIFQEQMSVEKNSAISLSIPVPGGLKELEVEAVSSRDGLALDNKSIFIEPVIRRVNISNTLPEGRSRDLLTRIVAALPDVQPADEVTAHLQIAATTPLPISNPKLWWLGIGPLSQDEKDKEAAVDLVGPYLIERGNPLLEGVTLGGVIWGGVQKTPLNVTPLISAGQYPLLSRLNGTRTTALLMNIDLARSNLSESPDWPVLFSNLVELRRNDLPGLQRWNYRLGESVNFRLYEGTGDPAEAGFSSLTLVHNGGSRSLTPLPVLQLSAIDEPGIYEIRTPTGLVDRFAVNFQDLQESDLRNLTPGEHAPEIRDDRPDFSINARYTAIVLLALALLLAAVLADWFVLRPRTREQVPGS